MASTTDRAGRLIILGAYLGAMWWIVTPEWRRSPALWMGMAHVCRSTALRVGTWGLRAERKYYEVVR